jgi:hypothetical protein
MARAQSHLGDDKAATLADTRAASLRAEAEREVDRSTSSLSELLADWSYAPLPTRDYWEGNLHVMHGRLVRGLESYSHGLDVDADCPELLFSRGWVRLRLGEAEGLSEIERAIELDPSWLYARRCLIAELQEGSDRRNLIKHRKWVARAMRWERFEGHLSEAGRARSLWAAVSGVLAAAKAAIPCGMPARGESEQY